MTSGMLDGFRVLGFDLETTGFNPRSDRIVQYALVGSDVDGSHINVQSMVNPGRGIPREASMVHGIFDEDVVGEKGFSDHMAVFAETVEGAVIVGHNVIDFDWRFVELEYARSGSYIPKPHAILDTLVIARSLGVPRPHKLGTLSDMFGISLERSHSADADAGATLLLLSKMMLRYPRKFSGTLLDFIGFLGR